jgi:hypothetical protein
MRLRVRSELGYITRYHISLIPWDRGFGSASTEQRKHTPCLYTCERLSSQKYIKACYETNPVAMDGIGDEVDRCDWLTA